MSPGWPVVKGKELESETLKELSHEIFRPVFWPVWMHLGLNVNCLCFFILKRVLRFYTVILSIDAFHTKPSRRFYESPRIIDISIKDTLMLLKNILGEPRNKLSIILRESMNLREGLTPFTAFFEVPLTQNK
jgi:hypothetical protein